MKKTVKLLFFLLVFCLILSGCHKHTFAEGYKYDYDYHWHESTCGHDNAVKKEAHSYSSWQSAMFGQINYQTCNVCGHVNYDGEPFNQCFEYGEWSIKTSKYDDSSLDFSYEEFTHECKGYYLSYVPTKLSFFVIPNEIKEIIGYSDYSDGDNGVIKTLVIPSTVEKIEVKEMNISNINGAISSDPKVVSTDFFYPFKGLETIEVASANKNFSSRDGILYNKEGTVLLKWPKAKEDCTVPEGTIELEDISFLYCRTLTEIVLPSSLKRIGESCFLGCASLSSVVIPDSVEIIEVEAFAYCYSLESVTLPKSLSVIPVCAFEGCFGLKNVVIPKSVKTIGAGAFYFCDSLTDISYEGTIKEWQSIEKGEEWNSEYASTVVHCSDGDVTI